MYYFDKDFLGQYLSAGKEIKVTVDNKVLTISDISDLEDNQGTGTEQSGDVNVFDYNDIVKIQIGPNIIDLDSLQTILADKPLPEKKPTNPVPKSDNNKEKEKEPDLAHINPHIIGRLMMKEYFKKYGRK